MKQKIFNLLPDWLKKLPHSDKIAHMIIGLPIFFVLCIFTIMWKACVITIIVAVLNELIDKRKKGNHFDWWDIIATIAIPVIVTVFNI